MNQSVIRAAAAFAFLGVISLVAFQNCSPVAVSDISSEAPQAPGIVQSIPQDCTDVGKVNGDTWWVPNGTTRDVVACTTGSGSLFKIYDEEAQVKCDEGKTVLTGQTRRTFTGQTEGLCNLDCGDHKNNDKWWAFDRNSRDPVQCTVGTGTQYRVYNEEVEYECQNTMILATGNKRRVATETLEGTCDLKCGDHQNMETWWVPGGQSRQAVQCAVGTGTQYKVYNDEIEYKCLNAVASTTGNTRQIDTGNIEGSCNLDCGDHKNTEKWWLDLPQTTETRRCSTALNVNSTVTYKNEAEYQCLNAITSATGNTKKTVVSETECPPLTFNNQDNIATVAYEDIFPGPGDHDYNDFVANIKVQETYNSLDQLTKIQIEYTPRLKLAGYFAKFILAFDGQVRGRDGFVSNVKDYKSLPMFEGDASIRFEKFDASGNSIYLETNVPKDKDLIVFDDTTKAVNQKPKVVITVTNLDPALNTLSQRNGLSIKRYRTVLFVTSDQGTKYDIELSDINPTMFDSSQLPMAFFVPVNWKPPGGGVNILQPYPKFKDHADYLYSNQPLDQEPSASRDWFNTLADPSKVISP